MKKRPLIIIGSLFLCGIVLFAVYFFVYLKKVAIYDHINIQFSGLYDDEITAIKTFGVTPLDKKIIINHKDTNNTNVTPGHYQSVGFVIPDTLASKITSVSATIKEKKYTYKISNLISTTSSGNAHTYLLPQEVKSRGSFLNKLSSAYPFNVVLPVLKKVLLVIQNISKYTLLIIGVFLIILCIIYLYKFFSEISQKSSIKKIITYFQEKRTRYLLLLITLIILILWPFIWPGQKISYFLIVLLYGSVVLQNIRLCKKSFVLYIFRVLMLIFLCFEIICGVLNSKKNTIKREIGNITMSSNISGWRSKPNTFEEKSFATFGNDTVYNIRVSTDEFGRRISREEATIKQKTENAAKKKHAIFLGCSFTLGSSVSYSSTFPFIFENTYPEYKSYNYGVGGWGPHQSCLLFDEGLNTMNNLSVPEDSGFCLYSFVDLHLDRVYGNVEFSLFRGNPDVFVYDNKLVYKKRSLIKCYFAKFLRNSETMQCFKIDISYPKTVKFYKRFAGIINYTAYKYWKMKPHGEFFVGLFPGWVKDTSWLTYLDPKIKILYVSAPEDYYTNNDLYLIPNDFHPTKELNSYYVKEFSKSIIK